MTLNTDALPPEPVIATGKPKVGIIGYVCSLLSFIPGLGVLVGLGFIVYGLVTPKKGGKILALIGLLGIAFTVAMYSLLFYQLFHGGFDKTFGKLAEVNLNQAVVNIEYYKSQNGHYPDSLETLLKSLPKDQPMMLDDISVGIPSTMASAKKSGKPQLFYYQLVDADHYYLLGVGPDKQPFTCDDVVPHMGDHAKTGLIVKDLNCLSPVTASPK